MPIEFLSPLMLWGLLAAVIPVVIHLLHRPRYQREPWAAMRFLRRAIEQQSRRLRFESWLLLLLRVAICGLVGLALAQPFLETGGRMFRSMAPVHRVIVVDCSASLGAEEGAVVDPVAPAGKRSFDRLRDLARIIIERGQQGDAFHLLRIGQISPRVIIRQAAFDKVDVLSELNKLSVLDESGDVLTTLRQVPALLRQVNEAPRKEVYILSDFQKTNWWSESEIARQQLSAALQQCGGASRLFLLDVGPHTRENLAITDLRPVGGGVASGELATLEVELRNFGPLDVQSLKLEVLVEGVVRHSQMVTVPAEGVLVVPCAVPVEGPSDCAILARVTSDTLRVDDQRHLVIPLTESIPVLLVDGQPGSRFGEAASDFVRLALAPSTDRSPTEPGVAPRIDPQVVALPELSTQDLSKFSAVYLCNVPEVPVEVADRLSKFVRAGGGLVIGLGDQVRPQAYNTTLHAGGAGLLPVELGEIAGDLTGDESFAFLFDESRHPILAPFVGNPDAGLTTTRVFRYFRTTLPDQPTNAQRVPHQVILRCASGDPILIERELGLGKVILVTTSLDDRWSTWPLWPSFVPMMHETLRYSISGRALSRQRLIGQPIEYRLPTTIASGSGSITTPQQVRVDLITEFPTDVLSSGDRLSQAVKLNNPDRDNITDVQQPSLNYSQTTQVGVYSLTLSSMPGLIQRFACNVDSAESDLTVIERPLLAEQLLAGQRHQFLSDLQPGSQSAALEATEGVFFSRSLLWIVVALFLLEQLTAWRFNIGVAALAAAATAFTAYTITGGMVFTTALFTAIALAIALWALARHALGKDPALR